MSEFIITRQTHWATPASITPDDGIFPQWKYDSRAMPGDIIEAHPDGFYRVEFLGVGLHGWDRAKRALVRAPTIPWSTVEQFLVGLYDSEDDATKKRVIKWAYYLLDWESESWNKNMVTVNGVTVEEWYMDIERLNQVKVRKKQL
jgi:hypothetical protein